MIMNLIRLKVRNISLKSNKLERTLVKYIYKRVEWCVYSRQCDRKVYFILF